MGTVRARGKKRSAYQLDPKIRQPHPEAMKDALVPASGHACDGLSNRYFQYEAPRVLALTFNMPTGAGFRVARLGSKQWRIREQCHSQYIREATETPLTVRLALDRISKCSRECAVPDLLEIHSIEIPPINFHFTIQITKGLEAGIEWNSIISGSR